MASIYKEIRTAAHVDDVWAAIADVGALHTRLVPGFVADTRLEGDARVVTFANGAVVREPIVTVDHANKRLVWSAEGGRTTHYNGSVQAFDERAGTRVVWTADLLPDGLAGDVDAAMEHGSQAMKEALDRAIGRRAGSAGLAAPDAAPFLDALAAAGPAPDRAAAMGLYGWLVGSWDLDVTHVGPRVLDEPVPGEWHFAWVLEGRSIQDVWIVPRRGATNGDAGAAWPRPPVRGTTLRTYDPDQGHWHVHWVDPVTQTFLAMIGRREGDDIVQLGRHPDGALVRWSFREIADDAFVWRGEASCDGGAAWTTTLEYRARRAGRPR